MLASDLPSHIREQRPYQPRYARVNGSRMHYVIDGVGAPWTVADLDATGRLYRLPAAQDRRFTGES
jgi:hypothetical protein